MKRLSVSFDIDRLREATEYVVSRCDFYQGGFDTGIQINLVHRPQDKTWDERIHGVYAGRTIDDRTSHPLYDDTDYTVFNEEFQDTYFHEVWETLRALPGSIGRMRLMRLQPHGCLSFHCDFEDRYHIPILTNPRCFFLMSNERNVFPEFFDTRVPSVGVFHLPADGSVYTFEAMNYHTAVNAGKTARVHLVTSVLKDEEKEWN